MLFTRFYDEQLAQASYLIGCGRTGTAVVVDPNRRTDEYIAAAEAAGLRITAVTETHIHADFVSGCRELAARTGAAIHLSGCGPPEWQYEFRREPGVVLLADRDTFRVGNVELRAVHTPGHTPEHQSFLVTGSAEASARQLFRSLAWFKTLPDHLQIWPGHGAGSACGKSMSAVPQSTVGYERRFNWAFAVTDESEFVRLVLLGQPEPPGYFAEMKRLNRSGPPVLGALALPERVAEHRIRSLLASGAAVVDTRPAAEFAAGYIPGTLSVPFNPSFPTWAGSLLPYDQDLYLLVVEGRTGLLRQVVQSLQMIGLDRVRGYFGAEALELWATEGRALGRVEQLAVGDLAARRNGMVVFDVRGRPEWEEGHLPGACLIPLPELPGRLGEVPADRPVAVHCQGGSRSAIAASLLLSRGERGGANVGGGFAAWLREGLPVER